MIIRWVAGVVAFLAIAVIWIALIGGIPESGEADPVTGAFQRVADVLALVLAVALAVGILAYLAVEFIQTGRVASLAAQFTTRTLVLIPVAIALNIILGAAVANALKIPIYLDSVGTILVGVLAGPLAGAVTGLLANVLWSYVIPPPFQSPPAAAFAIVAAVIGLMAGALAHGGLLRPRPDRPMRQLAVAGVLAGAAILALAYLAFVAYTAFLASIDAGAPSVTPTTDEPLLTVLAWLAVALVAGTIVGLFALLFVRRDLTAAYVVLAGAVTGVVAGLISAPISAGVFGGVTGAGTDFLVAALREAGASVYLAALGQSLISDPIDKITTYVVVYLIVTAVAARAIARFPQGERLVATPATTESDEAGWRGPSA